MSCQTDNYRHGADFDFSTLEISQNTFSLSPLRFTDILTQDRLDLLHDQGSIHEDPIWTLYPQSVPRYSPLFASHSNSPCDHSMDYSI